MSLLEDLLLAPPTESDNNSLAIYSELLWHRETWRWYSQLSYPETPGLAERFIVSHALVPGMLTDLMPSTIPVMVIHTLVPMPDRTVTIVHGGVWANGAILHIEPREHAPHWVLLVAEETAQTWAYPPQFTYLSQQLRQVQSSDDKNSTDSLSDAGDESSSPSSSG